MNSPVVKLKLQSKASAHLPVCGSSTHLPLGLFRSPRASAMSRRVWWEGSGPDRSACLRGILGSFLLRAIADSTCGRGFGGGVVFLLWKCPSYFTRDIRRTPFGRGSQDPCSDAAAPTVCCFCHETFWWFCSSSFTAVDTTFGDCKIELMSPSCIAYTYCTSTLKVPASLPACLRELYLACLDRGVLGFSLVASLAA